MLLKGNEFIDEKSFQSLEEENIESLKLIASTVKKTKENSNKN